MLINKQSAFSSRELCTAIIIRSFANLKKWKFISSKFRKQGKFVTSKEFAQFRRIFFEISHWATRNAARNFADISSKIRKNNKRNSSKFALITFAQYCIEIDDEGVEDDERTITIVEDVVSVSLISQQSFQPLSPVQEEGLDLDNDLHVQGPLDYCGTTYEAPANEEQSTKVIDNRE